MKTCRQLDQQHPPYPHISTHHPTTLRPHLVSSTSTSTHTTLKQTFLIPKWPLLVLFLVLQPRHILILTIHLNLLPGSQLHIQLLYTHIIGPLWTLVLYPLLLQHLPVPNTRMNHPLTHTNPMIHNLLLTDN